MVGRVRVVGVALCLVVGGVVAAYEPAKTEAQTPELVGELYYLNDDADSDPDLKRLWMLDTTTAARTDIGPSLVESQNVGLSEGPDTSSLFGSVPSGLFRQPLDGSPPTSIGGTDAQEGLAWDDTNDVLYGSLSNSLHTIDPSTGANGPALAAPGADVEGLAWRGTDGRIYGTATNGNLYAYTIATDTWALVGATGMSNPEQSGLAWDSLLDVFYAIGEDGNLYRLDPDTGAGTLIGNTGLSEGGGLAFRVVEAPPTPVPPVPPVQPVPAAPVAIVRAPTFTG